MLGLKQCFTIQLFRLSVVISSVAMFACTYSSVRWVRLVVKLSLLDNWWSRLHCLYLYKVWLLGRVVWLPLGCDLSWPYLVMKCPFWPYLVMKWPLWPYLVIVSVTWGFTFHDLIWSWNGLRDLIWSSFPSLPPWLPLSTSRSRAFASWDRV